MEKWKDNVSFVLIDTLESGNIGASARAIKNLGFSRLVLVRPVKFPSDEAGWFAHGAQDVLARALVYRSLEDALKDASVVIGTTRRSGKKRGKVYPIREAAESVKQLSVNNHVALLFGREDRGLTNEETAACSFMISIPASFENPSFNLAQALLIIAYELSRASCPFTTSAAVISNEELSNLFGRLRGILRMAGYGPKGIRDNEKEILTDLRRVISRAGITEREARMLHGIISQIEESLAKKQGYRG